MKFAVILSILAISLTLQACYSSDATRQGGTTSSSEQRERSDVVTLELADYLRKVPGVSVSGRGANTQVRVRGESSILGGNEPLFVVDGRVMGQSYQSVNFLSAWDISNVRVLKGSEAASYGSRGANGVIEIDTKR